MSRFVKWFDHRNGCNGVEQDINVYAAENNLSIINVCPYYFWGAYAIFEKVEQGKGAYVVPRRDTYYFEEGKPPVLIETSENRRSKIAREIFEEIEREIVAALRSNYSAKQERVEKQIPDDLASYMCEGKIAALLGIDDFIAELKKKYTEGEE